MVEGRLLIISPFADGVRRSTALTAQKRNEFIGSISDESVVIYAGAGSKLAGI